MEILEDVWDGISLLWKKHLAHSKVRKRLLAVLLVLAYLTISTGGWRAIPYLLILFTIAAAIGLYVGERVGGFFAGGVFGTGKVSTDYLSRGYTLDMSRAVQLVRENKTDEATELYESIIEKAPQEPRPLWLLAQTFESMQKLKSCKSSRNFRNSGGQ